jgi:hypothetical protein
MAHGWTKRLTVSISLGLTLFLFAGPSYGKHKKGEEPPFEYLAGSENVERGSAGRLEVLKEGFTFKGPGAALSIPFSQVTVMQYRPDISPEVMAMKIAWNPKPQLARVRENQYFTIVWNDQGKLRAVIFRVNEDTMRPYFAEIELQSGKSVQEYRSFSEF